MARRVRAQYGPRATSTMTTEQVPLEWTCGWVRVIDVKHLVGSTEPQSWPTISRDHGGGHQAP